MFFKKLIKFFSKSKIEQEGVDCIIDSQSDHVNIYPINYNDWPKLDSLDGKKVTVIKIKGV